MNIREELQAVKPNVVDRVVTYFNPMRGAARLRARMQLAIASSSIGGYIGARMDRRATGGWTVLQSDADAASLPDIPRLRDRSRDLERNSPLACGAISTTVQGTVGTGLALQCKPDFARLGWTQEQAAEWAAVTEAEFRLWAETTWCDITRTQNLYGLQNLAFRSTLVSGDAIALLPMPPLQPGAIYRTRIQVIEADRIANPSKTMADGAKLENGNRVWAGVEKDPSGAPVAYHILREHPGSKEGRLKWETDRYEAFGSRTGRRNVLHLFDRLRPDQSRGIPYLAPVIETLHQITRYTEAELMAAVVSSFFTVFVKTPTGEGLNVAASAAAESAGIMSYDATQTSGTTSNTEPLRLGPGVIVDLADGDEIQTADPKRPNTAFDGFVLALMRQIGVAIGLPFEVLVKHFTASYSAARAALLEAWKFYMGRRHWLALVFCQPVYEAWLDEAVSIGRIAAPGYFADPAIRQAYCGSEWIGDAPGSVDPLKEVQAARERIALEISTRQRETMELTGQVWEDVHAQAVREKRMRERDGMDTAAQPSQPTPAEQPDQGDQSDSDLETPPNKENR